ncbi:MAG: HAMP domain-containing sensor histidine kinase [Bacteroidota bacterium]
MNNAPIRALVLLATIALVGIIASQMYWSTNAVAREQQQFNHSVQMALHDVVESLCQIDGNDIPLNNPIDRISNNYFIVRTNNKINLASLEYALKAEFEKRAIVQDFEYGVYDCEHEQMVYGDLVQLSSEDIVKKQSLLPQLVNEAYYFGILFPGRSTGFFGDTDFWKITTLLTLVVIGILGYSIFIVFRQKRLGAVQRDFVNNMTHEFKTPIATLKVVSEVFENASREDSDRLQHYSKLMSTEIERLEKQVTQVLRSSWLEHRPRLKHESIDLNQLILNTAESFKHRFDDRGIDFSFQEGEEAMIIGDHELLKTVFYNLIDNAIKYGGDKLCITVTPNDRQLLISVADNGKGISDKDKANVFRKFYRVTKGNRHDTKGFGLGLFFVKNILSRHGATIQIADRPGCEFLIKFKKVG